MMPKFIIPDIHPRTATTVIQGQDARHIYKVLRLNKGDCIDITNGAGIDFTAVITSASLKHIELSLTSVRDSLTESPIKITLCSGMLKDKKMDLVIKHVTQLGIQTWIPFFSDRSVPTPDAKRLQNRKNRWEAIAKESVKQCRRSRLPHITPPMTFEELLCQAESDDIKIAFWEKASRALTDLKKTSSPANILILIGPEGGFSEKEINSAQKKGFSSYSLGPRILRAETAAISTCTMIQHLLGDM